MGIFINLSIVPDRISAGKWSEVYRETLILLEHFPFLDRVKAENGYYYAARAKHCIDVNDCYAGWHVAGDMCTGSTMESFCLIDDIAYYQNKTRMYEANDQDILLNDLSSEIMVEGPPTAWVWGAKTQGRPAHLYLLAIGCLICHRFPNAALVSGDISAAQCHKAVEWANQYLGSPIDVPVTADAARLLPRLLSSGLKECDILAAFYQLTLEPCHGEMGDYLRANLPEQIIEQYYKQELQPRERSENKLYLKRSAVKEYLGLGFDLSTLCRMVLIDTDGNKLQPRELMKVLLEMKLHVPFDEKVLYDFVSSPKDRGSAEIETVNGLMLSALFAIHGGRNRNVAAYIPLEEIVFTFESVVGIGDYNAMVAELLEEIEASKAYKHQNELYDGANSIYREEKQRCEMETDEAQYDIVRREDVISYCEGNTIEPGIHAGLLNYAKQLREIGEKNYASYVKGLDEVTRKEFFHKSCRVLIPKEIEDMFFAKIMEDKYIVRYVGLYSVEVPDSVSWAIRGFLWNPELLDHYWAIAEGTD